MKRTMGRLTLEVSLKPFSGDLSPAGIRRTCETICDNWRNLGERFERLSVLLWVSDGNDILDWGGDLDAEMVWGHSINFCNHNDLEVYEPTWEYPPASPFRRNPPKMRYRDLRDIIAALKARFKERFGKELMVGATIDPGPEFAESKFKIQRHPEVLSTDDRKRMLIAMRFMSHQAILKADSFKYASFPKGIPEGTSIGTFIGSQFEAAAKALGFDYLWLSNGFGYTHNTWSFKGRCFYGESFDEKAAAKELAMLKKFWIDLRKACPKGRIEVRGTNYTVGMDISVDGVSHKAVHKLGRIAIAPPNLPNLDEVVGLEMAVMMSRMSKPLTKETLYRFYLNDPWFPCNPWFDRFNRETFDIYCPTCVSRVMPDASVEPPSNLSVLSIDTEKGEMPKDEANEVTPHFLRALNEAPDQPGPVILVYPYDEYHAILERSGGPLGLPFAHDWFLSHAITSGLPLNTVMSTDTFMKLQADGRLPDAVYVSPAPPKGWACSESFLKHIGGGGRMLLYGPLAEASKGLLSALGIKISGKGAEGLFNVRSVLEGDFLQGCKDSRKLLHRASISGGPLREVVAKEGGSLIEVSGKSGSFAYAVHKANSSGGSVSWIRGSVHFDATKYTLTPEWDSPADFAMSGVWMRLLLAKSGWTFRQAKLKLGARDIYVFVKRHGNAFYFAGHKPDATSKLRVSSPFGAPVFGESETLVRDGLGEEFFGKSLYSEVRAFVRMREGVVRCKEMPTEAGFTRNMVISGLKNAGLTVFPSKKAVASRKVDAKIGRHHGVDAEFSYDDKEACIRFAKLSCDELCIRW